MYEAVEESIKSEKEFKGPPFAFCARDLVIRIL